MRSRNIKPGFFKNEDLADIEPLGRLLFIKTSKVEELLKQLHDAGFIIIYNVDGSSYIQVQNFLKHQNPHHRETESVIPDPQVIENIEAQGKPRESPGKASESTRLASEIPGQAQGKPSTSPADSGFLKPDSPSLKQCKDNFEKFWSAYPRKIGKDAAKREWLRKKDKPDIDTILEAIEQQKKSKQWTKDDGQYIPHPKTWISQGRWADEVEPEHKKTKWRL